MGNKSSKQKPESVKQETETVPMNVEKIEPPKEEAKPVFDLNQSTTEEKETKQKQRQKDEKTMRRRLKLKIQAEVAKSIKLTNTTDVNNDEKKFCEAEQCLDLLELINDSYLSQKHFLDVVSTVEYKQTLDGVKWTRFQERIFDRIHVYEALLGAWFTKRALELPELESHVGTLISGWTVRCRIVAAILRDLLIERGVVIETGSDDLRRITETVEKDFAEKERVTIAELAEYLYAKNYFEISDDDRWILSTTGATPTAEKTSEIVRATEKPKGKRERASIYMRRVLAAGPLRSNYNTMRTSREEQPKPAEGTVLPAMQVDTATATKCVESTTSLSRADDNKGKRKMGPITRKGGFEEATEKEMESFQKAAYSAYILLRQWGNDNNEQQKTSLKLLEKFLSTKKLPNPKEAVELLTGLDHTLQDLSPPEEAYNTRWKMDLDDWENVNRLLKIKVDGLRATDELPRTEAQQLLLQFRFSCLAPTN